MLALLARTHSPTHRHRHHHHHHHHHHHYYPHPLLASTNRTDSPGILEFATDARNFQIDWAVYKQSHFLDDAEYVTPPLCVNSDVIIHTALCCATLAALQRM
jgi:hypothetical protein